VCTTYFYYNTYTYLMAVSHIHLYVDGWWNISSFRTDKYIEPFIYQSRVCSYEIWMI